MVLLVKQAIVIDPNSPFHNQQKDIHIQDGQIMAIGDQLSIDGAQIIERDGLHVSPGWVDIGMQIGDPGFEHREDIVSATRAAALGGYTAIAPFPNTDPVMDTKASLNYWRNQSNGNLVEILPIGAITSHCNGKDITEMIDMRRAGAIAFSDGSHSTQNNGMMMRALQYVKAFDGVVINRAFDASLAGGGHMHEGLISTQLGMKGISHLAEDMMVARDINLADYTESKVHIHSISTAGSVDLIRQAKAKGIQVTCSVTPLNLFYQQDSLEDFDTNFKVLPPLREKSDSEALLAGLRDGTIDFVVSNHVPLEEERKKLEFAYADFGAIGLETCYALLNTHLSNLGPEKMLNLLGAKARQIFGLRIPGIQEGAKAELTLFLPEQKWTFGKEQIGSKSKNSPLLGQPFTGSILGIIQGQRSHFSQLR
ncbi:MAG TPA: dihydroorotase [Saprospiraceae bacterium]|nr:dihydroorotase [Saprospiraceae bacterium]